MSDLAQTVTTIYLFASALGFLSLGIILYLMGVYQVLGVKPVSGDIWLCVIGVILAAIGALLYAGGRA